MAGEGEKRAAMLTGEDAPASKETARKQADEEELAAAAKRAAAMADDEESPAAEKVSAANADEEDAPAAKKVSAANADEEEEAPAPEEKTMGADVKSDEPEVFDVNLDVLFVVAEHLPSKSAYAWSAVAKSFLERLAQPNFLRRHMSPRPPFIDDVARGFFIQPVLRHDGYSHLIVTGPGKPRSNLAVRVPAYDDEEDDGDFRPELLDGQAVDAPPFFERSVRDIDVCFVASHGRLLLGRSLASFFVCSPEEDRWVKIPLPDTVVDSCRAAAGLRYEVHAAAAGTLDFDVVVLVRVGDTRIAVSWFSSSEAKWRTAEVEHEEAAAWLGGRGVCPGIHAAGSFFWKDRESGRVLCYEVAGAHLSVIPEPPLEEKYPRRAGSSLGTVHGDIRLSVFDVRDEEGYGLQVLAIDGVISVWTKVDGGAAGAWSLISSANVSDVLWFYNRFIGYEIPVDYASANSRRLIVKKERRVLERDLETGEKVFMSGLYHGECDLTHSLYRQFDTFPFFQ